MIPLNNRKILIRIILAGMLIMFYDVILDSLFSVVHIAFEWFELALEHLIEHLFHTTRQQSQIIVFYLLWLMALYPLYWLWRALPNFFNQLKERLVASVSQYKSSIIRYWGEQSSIQKIKWATSFALSISCLSLFAFS